jgi:hypothetical protein
MAVKISRRVFFYLGPGQNPRNGGITFFDVSKKHLLAQLLPPISYQQQGCQICLGTTYQNGDKYTV